ncbi:xylulokinase [Ruoffia tabacinasalis]|uniref:Xylulose kinase n=1 Tax=Ruoffia tabacinasalis TaxID=87458 RepID=A0A5R9DU81_9LACT|nr:xylulokinase [Ruoffia tabacinasalis]TLQ39865.1 xylulokinase [Ruoffia tabacinasalis]
MSYVLGIDLGTGSLKGSLFDNSGLLIDTASSKYSIISQEKGFSEQNPKDWIKALNSVFEQLISKVEDMQEKLEAISFSGQMHSLVLIDKNKEVLRNAILWNDVRTTKQCNRIMDEYGEELLTITKNVALEGFTLPKILWIQENEPNVWEQVDKILLPKDYLGLYLTGNTYTDYSDAAGTLLLDIGEKKWSKAICDKFNVPLNFLPELKESTQYVGKIKDSIMKKFKLKKEIQIFAGGADNACGAIGAGIINDETAMVSIGTSGVFLSFEDETDKQYKGKLHYFNHAIQNRYYSMGVTLAAGYSLDWFKKTFAKDVNFDDLLTGTENVGPGSEGLFFTPYITGERSPYFDSEIRGSFIGIDANHTFNHFVKSVLEGITFSLKESQDILVNYADKTINSVVSIGGGSKSDVWLQIQADIFNANILTLEIDEGPGLGAAMLAAVGAGWYENFEEATEAFVKYNDVVHPIVENVELYEKIYHKYKEIYPSTKKIMHSL